jgi:hypothetical protein
MTTYVYKMIFMAVLLLSAWISQTSAPSSQTPMAMSIPPTAVAASESSPTEDALQTGATTSRERAGLILGNFLILCFYSFPMSFAENWAISDQKRDKKSQNTDSPVGIEPSEEPALVIGSEAPASIDDRTNRYGRLPQWAQELPRVPAGLAAGGCLMILVVVLGAVAFALYYLFSGQPEKVSQIIPRFAYWFPFAFLGMVTDIPFTFRIFDLENRRKKVLLRLIVWWTPRVVIVIFMLNLPVVRDLDPATTALVVLAIDGVLTAFFMWLHTIRKRRGMRHLSA